MSSEKVVNSLVNRILEIERFQEIDEEQTAAFVKEQRNQNTVRKTDSDTKLFIQWLSHSKKDKRDILLIPSVEMDKLLAMFILSIKKGNGEEYEPSSMVSKYNSIGRFLKENSNININIDAAFSHSR